MAPKGTIIVEPGEVYRNLDDAGSFAVRHRLLNGASTRAEPPPTQLFKIPRFYTSDPR
jgi:hypothetical protein